jgi:hypothetical protein
VGALVTLILPERHRTHPTILMVSRFKAQIVAVVACFAWSASCSPLLAQVGVISQQTPPSNQAASSHEPAGKLSGTLIDSTGALVSRATVRLTKERTADQTVSTDDQGQFSFASVAPGPYQLTITANGFATQTFSGDLRPGEIQQVPPIMLNIATTVTTVEVGLPRVEVAQEQIKAEEKQRVLGVIPDFYVSFVPNAAPLNFRQKFELAYKSATDPFTLTLAGAIAGIQQAQNYLGGYGQEGGGYAKRYGATYADLVTSTLIGDALLASVFKQDPRYFYKGTGSKKSRAFYAITHAVICKGDNGHWQPDYSRVLGHLAAGGISNLYYPASDRHGASLTFENTAIGIAGSAAANLFQEFVVRRFIPKARKADSFKP